MKQLFLCLVMVLTPSMLFAQGFGSAGKTGDSRSRAGRKVIKEVPEDPKQAPQPADDMAALKDLNSNLSYSVGWLGGTQVYFLFAYIGTIGDGFGNDVYDEDTATELIMEVINNTKGTADMLGKLKPKMNADDAEAIGNMIDIYKDLNTYSTALGAFIKSRSQADLDKYQNARKTVWPKIQDFLGLDKS